VKEKTCDVYCCTVGFSKIPFFFCVLRFRFLYHVLCIEGWYCVAFTHTHTHARTYTKFFFYCVLVLSAHDDEHDIEIAHVYRVIVRRNWNTANRIFPTNMYYIFVRAYTINHVFLNLHSFYCITHYRGWMRTCDPSLRALLPKPFAPFILIFLFLKEEEETENFKLIATQCSRSVSFTFWRVSSYRRHFVAKFRQIRGENAIAWFTLRAQNFTTWDASFCFFFRTLWQWDRISEKDGEGTRERGPKHLERRKIPVDEKPVKNMDPNLNNLEKTDD
jgi:hypothetical protein